MQPKNPDYRGVVQAIFKEAVFIRELGLDLMDLGPGWCQSDLLLQAKHLQQDGYVHAGVQATVADHTAGSAAATLMLAEQRVLTVEFKINLLRPGRGERLRCIAKVLKSGRSISVAESEVYALAGRDETLIAKATVTLVLQNLSN